MKPLFQYSYLRRAILVALLGTAGATSAATLIEKDTLIDGRSPSNEDYQVKNGATLTAQDAVAGKVTISDGHLVMDGGQIKGYLMLDAGSTATIENADVKFAALMGNTRLQNTTIETQLNVFDAQLAAAQVRMQQFVAGNAEVIVENGVIANNNKIYSGAVDFNGTNGTFIGSTIKGYQSGIFLTGKNQVGLDGSSVRAVNGPAFMARTGTQDILLTNGSTAGSDTGELLTAKKRSEVSLSLNASQAAGTVRAEEGAVVDVALSNGSQLSGAMTNVNSLSLDNHSLYEMTADSDINVLTVAGGTVKFAAGDEYRTLTLGTLSGSGHFVMNADLLTGEADLLDITDSASGKHTLHVAASGREVGRDALTLVRTGGGDAEFSLNDGRLDVGAWQHTLVRNGNQWALVQAAGSTSASTDAVLSMAFAPQFIHEYEMNVLRSRLDDTRTRSQSGMWGAVLHSRSDVEGA